MYSITGYGRMIASKSRTLAYAQAIEQSVGPESVVLDIGAGTGAFTLIACRAGARRVYAIESGNVIEVAKEIVAENGLTERVKFIQGISTNATLPERMDVIISDIRGILPLFNNHIPSIVDARQRFLAPGGILIPARDVMWAAVAEAENIYDEGLDVWTDNFLGFHMSAARRVEINSMWKVSIEPDQLLTEPKRLATLDYATIEDPNLKTTLEWKIEKAGTAHGVCVWFDSVLLEGISFSNAPGEPETVYGKTLFPMPSPVELAVGDIVRFQVQAKLVEDNYIWSWNTKITGAGKLKADFKQSTFQALHFSLEELRKRADNYVPELNEDGMIDSYILSQINRETSVREIAVNVAERFPERFPQWHEALGHVGDLAEKYSR